MFNSAGSIANLKHNLSKIALDVHHFDDFDDDLTSYVGDSDRIRSHNFAHSQIQSNPTLPNGDVDSPYVSEIEHYKAEIKKLRESEAEIKALSVNYAALLKEKEDYISKLDQENVSLKQAFSNVPSKILPNSSNLVKGSQEQPPNRQNKLATPVKNHSSGNQWQNRIALKQDKQSNGFAHGIRADPSSSYSNSIANEKELADRLEEKNRLLDTMQAEHELQMNQLRLELEKERKTLENTKLKLQDEARVRGSLTEELNTLRSDSNKTSIELNNLRKEVDDKVSEITCLQAELSRMNSEGINGTESLRTVITRLEKENVELKMEKEKLEFALKDISAGNKRPGSSNKSSQSLVGFPGKDELERSLQKSEKDLKETCQERDKALKELARLKQHLLDKELEESEKMDEDSKIIEDLQQQVDYQKATILNLERALQQTRASQEEARMRNDHELVKSKEIIEDLKKKVTSYMRIIDVKNTELLNLQTALGQYYAEVEAKERLEEELSLAREEYAKISQLVQDSNQKLEAFTKEKEEILAKLAQSEKTASDWRNRVDKLEEDNVKLRRALEQSMSRLNRMSMDSDFLVDRRIVIKLLVTYFQRNHSKEVLDLMVRMLGFSEEDKQRIGGAQQGAGKGVVRGVLGLPGRLVGGIIGGGGSPGTPTNATSENQSFADLWVDFLLKESEEREKRESLEATGNVDSSPSVAVATSPLTEQRAGVSGQPPIISSTNPSIHTSRTLYSYGNTRRYDNAGSEFSTVPLTPSNSFM